MRKTLAVGLSAGVLLVWSFCHDLSVRAQVGPAAATENGDVNGDGQRDIADPIYLLNWIFEGGLEPVPFVCAQDDREFGHRVAGLYFVNFDSDLGSFKGLLTVGSDGSVLLSSQTQYGHIAPAAFQSIFHGRWTRTGDSQLTVDTFMLFYGELGVPPAIHGADVGTWRWVWDVAADFSRLSGGTVSSNGWRPAQDPIDDPGECCPPGLKMTARRL